MDDLLKCNFLNGDLYILIQILLKIVPTGPVGTKIALSNVIVDSHYLNQW